MDLCLEESAFICRAAIFVSRSGSCKLTRWWKFFLSFPFVICFFLKRFTKARDFEEKNIVSTRDGSYYMENNCVHGKKHHNFTQQPQFQWPETKRIIAFLLIDIIAWFLNLARRGGELDISKNQGISLGCNVCTRVYICGNSIGIRWHDDQPVSEQEKSKE